MVSVVNAFMRRSTATNTHWVIISEEYGHDKLLDEEAVELLKPKSKTVFERKKETDKIKDALMSCEEMCSENAGVIKALSDEFREFREQVLQEISNIKAAAQKDE